MIAYKFLRSGRSLFTGATWPAPRADRPGEWMDVEGPLALCANGLHACRASQLPPWMGVELWAVELDGEILETPPALVARRGRLIGVVSSWDPATQAAFAADCALRAARTAGEDPTLTEVAAVVSHFAEMGLAAPAGYWTAVVAGQAASGIRKGSRYDEAFGAERAVQADWLTDRLALQVG